MLTVHYTVYRRIDLESGKVETSEGNEALSIIRALVYQFGELENLRLPYYSPELGVSIETVEASNIPKIVVTFKKEENPPQEENPE